MMQLQPSAPFLTNLGVLDLEKVLLTRKDQKAFFLAPPGQARLPMWAVSKRADFSC